MKTPLTRLRAGLATLGGIFIIAVVGYRVAGRSWLDAVYMVVVTLSSVGYGETSQLSPGLQVFTILVIVFGVSTAVYIVGGFIQMMAEGEINRALGLRRVTREIERIAGHVIICGFGRMGEVLARELHRHKQHFVIIEHDPDRIAEACSLGYLTMNDNATEDEALLQAGVQRARTVVTTLPSDADNVFITLTSRNLNPGLQIIARGEFETTEKKLTQAGANRVVLPATTGALRMAAMVTRPSTIELIELVAGHHIAEVEFDELTIPADSPLVGCTVRESQTRSRHGLLIVAVRHSNGQLLFNPGADMRFQGGDSVIVMGRPGDIESFLKEYGI